MDDKEDEEVFYNLINDLQYHHNDDDDGDYVPGDSYGDDDRLESW